MVTAQVKKNKNPDEYTGKYMPEMRKTARHCTELLCCSTGYFRNRYARLQYLPDAAARPINTAEFSKQQKRNEILKQQRIVWLIFRQKHTAKSKKKKKKKKKTNPKLIFKY